MRYLLYAILSLLCATLSLLAQDATTKRGTRQERPKSRGEASSTIGQSPQTSPNTEATQTLERITWQRTLYRQLSLNDGANAALAYPQRPHAGKDNLLSLLFSLLAEGRIKAYQYIDGEEQFSPEYELRFEDLLTRFSLQYQRPEDSPSELVKAYYIKEQNYFNQANARLGHRILALCPILYDLGDYGEVPKPLFWVKYSDLKPYISQHIVQLSPDNEAMRGTLADFFELKLYQGKIVKTQNLTGKSLAELSRDSTELKARQARLEAELKAIEQSLSLPDSIVERSQGQAPKAKADKRKVKPKQSRPKQGKAGKMRQSLPTGTISARGLS